MVRKNPDFLVIFEGLRCSMNAPFVLYDSTTRNNPVSKKLKAAGYVLQHTPYVTHRHTPYVTYRHTPYATWYYSDVRGCDYLRGRSALVNHAVAHDLVNHAYAGSFALNY
jgi:hypothetical protein